MYSFNNIHHTALLSILITLIVSSCGSGAGKSESTDSTGESVCDTVISVSPKYARGFDMKKLGNGVTLVDISDPERSEKEVFRFAIMPEDVTAEIPDCYTVVKAPVSSVVCMTSLQLSNFIKLGITDKVVGITSTRHLKNSTINKQIKDGLIHKIGIEGNFDKEVIMAINPDVILISPFKRGGYDAIKGVGVPMLPHLGYKELTPLGQAEWIKLVGLLTGKSEEANEIFRDIETRYNRLKDLTADVENRPMVMSGEMRGGNWYAVGGESFLAHLFRDAGADYFLKDNKESGGVTLDFETVYANASESKFWRIVNSYDGEFGYDTLGEFDKRYTDFDAWKNHGVIYCNMKEVPFYESMPVEPENVLADFIHVFHPELLSEHKPVYYHLLK